VVTPKQVYGVIGNPIGHSLSPLLHNTGYVATKRDAMFLPFLVQDLGEFLKAIPEFGLRGIGVTLPHKQAIMQHLAGCESMAEKIGAVNTVVVAKNGKLLGSNTDYLGVLRALQGRLHLPGSRVLILGAGGSARAGAFALAHAGAEVLICARRESAARELAKSCNGQVIARKYLNCACFQLIVNATPVGMYPHDLTSPLFPRELNCEIVMDLISSHCEQNSCISRHKGICVISGRRCSWRRVLRSGSCSWGAVRQSGAMRRAVMAKLRSEETSAVGLNLCRSTASAIAKFSG
jgi:shikimate dehydrogenase